MKKIIYQPGFLILLAGNAWCAWYFSQDANAFGNIIWIYWLQSVIIGIFNFLDLLTIKNFQAGDLKINDRPVTRENKGCAAWFFLLHYGFFHLGYMIFLAISYHSHLDKWMILLGAAAFFIEALISFRQKKIFESTTTMSIGSIFFLPYLRIIPMHLTILAPAFLKIQPSMVFIILKSVADIILYIVTGRMYRRQQSNSNAAADTML
jgi:hypothetical protein